MSESKLNECCGSVGTHRRYCTNRCGKSYISTGNLLHVCDLVFPRPYEYWIKMDLEWLRVCHAVLRIPGPSSGADGEVVVAERLGIPVFTDIRRLMVEIQP